MIYSVKPAPASALTGKGFSAQWQTYPCLKHGSLNRHCSANRLDIQPLAFP